jgi:hypothetical protein
VLFYTGKNGQHSVLFSLYLEPSSCHHRRGLAVDRSGMHWIAVNRSTRRHSLVTYRRYLAGLTGLVSVIHPDPPGRPLRGLIACVPGAPFGRTSSHGPCGTCGDDAVRGERVGHECPVTLGTEAAQHSPTGFGPGWLTPDWLYAPIG